MACGLCGAADHPLKQCPIYVRADSSLKEMLNKVCTKLSAYEGKILQDHIYRLYLGNDELDVPIDGFLFDHIYNDMWDKKLGEGCVKRRYYISAIPASVGKLFELITKLRDQYPQIIAQAKRITNPEHAAKRADSILAYVTTDDSKFEEIFKSAISSSKTINENDFRNINPVGTMPIKGLRGVAYAKQPENHASFGDYISRSLAEFCSAYLTSAKARDDVFLAEAYKHLQYDGINIAKPWDSSFRKTPHSIVNNKMPTEESIKLKPAVVSQGIAEKQKMLFKSEGQPPPGSQPTPILQAKVPAPMTVQPQASSSGPPKKKLPPPPRPKRPNFAGT